MSLRNLAWTVVLLAWIACGCSEDRSKQHHEHKTDGAEPCCEFHAKKEAPVPERVELGKGAAGGVQVTATQVGGLTPGDVALVQIKTDKPLPEGSKIRAWIGTEQTKDRISAEYCDHHEEWDAEVFVPAKIAPDMKWWIEVMPKAEPSATTSFAIKP